MTINYVIFRYSLLQFKLPSNARREDPLCYLLKFPVIFKSSLVKSNEIILTHLPVFCVWFELPSNMGKKIYTLFSLIKSKEDMLWYLQGFTLWFELLFDIWGRSYTLCYLLRFSFTFKLSSVQRNEDMLRYLKVFSLRFELPSDIGKKIHTMLSSIILIYILIILNKE